MLCEIHPGVPCSTCCVTRYLPRDSSVESHLEAEKVSFLGAQVQRRASPVVPGVDLGPVGQQVADYQVLIGGGCNLKSRLRRRAEVHGLLGFPFAGRGVAVLLYLSVVLLHVQGATLGHVRRQRVSEGPSTLSHRDVEEPVGAGKETAVL